jgi:Na+-translocating ferredoxin:NAD+ oxidoreductase RnfG subunit
MAKPVPGWLMIGLTAIASFSTLFAVNFITEPILLNRENAQYLDLLDLNTFAGYSIDETIFTTGTLSDAGIKEVKTFRQQNNIVAITYKISMDGYNPGIEFSLGIRAAIIEGIRVDGHNETLGFGATLMNDLSNTIVGLTITDNASWTAAMLAQTTGATFTMSAMVAVMTAIAQDYQQRTNP